MSSTEQKLSIAALIVALIAILLTSNQLIAQIVATAEGTRKCSKSVLGPWHNSTKPYTKTIWKRNWKEVRLETRFIVPEISLTTSVKWINYVMYDVEAQRVNAKKNTEGRITNEKGGKGENGDVENGRDENRASWKDWHEDEHCPSTKLSHLKSSTDKKMSSKSQLEGLGPTRMLRRLYWFLKPSERPLPPDCLLGGDRDLDSLLFHPDYDDRAPDRVGWINLLTFLRVEMERSAITNVIQQRWWDRYPAEPAVTIDPDGIKRQTPVALNIISWPKIRFVQHSWDFVPPDVVKPLASSTVGDIAIIVRRTGMIWKTFEPHKAIMSAEGGPHVINSTEQKGLGIVLQYRCLDGSLTDKVEEQRQHQVSHTNNPSSGNGIERQGPQVRASWQKLFWPEAGVRSKDVESSIGNVDDQRSHAPNRITTGINSHFNEDFEGGPQNPHGPWPESWDNRYASADKRLFGILPSDPTLGIKDFRHRTAKDVKHELKLLARGSPNDNNEALDSHIDKAMWLDRYEFNDILNIVPEVSRQRGKGMGYYYKKNYHANVMNFTKSILSQLITKYLAGETFIEELGTAADGRPQTHRDGSRKRGAKLPGRTLPPTETMEFAQKSVQLAAEIDIWNPDIMRLEFLHNLHEETTRYFVTIADRIPFLCLLGMHFNSAVWASWQARDDVQHKYKGMFEESEGHPWRNRNMELYFCYLPRYIEYMAQGKGGTKCADEELVIEAWLMLMARGILFHCLHLPKDLEGEYLPTEFYGSRLPVWLA